MGKSSRLVIAIMLLLLAVFAGWQILSTPGLKPVVVSIYAPARIEAENRVVNVGKVETDSKVHQSFVLYNKGGKHLRISEVETSCGCTVAELSKKVLAPGDFTRLAITMDTSIKLGEVIKKITVHSNDPKRPALDLFLTGTVMARKMEAHEQVALKAADPLVLFKGDCATCHVDRGKGKTGQALFQADCAMCHGLNGQGTKNSGPSLLTGDYEKPEVLAHVQRVIAEGSPQSPQMPPFSRKLGGPLNDDEIDSLVQFLKFQSLQNKMGLLGKDAAEEEDEAAFREALRQPH
jgi:mono/diheme cytochrome c family protein